MERKIAAGEFKSKCLKIMDIVYSKGTEFVITKRNIPVAKIVPPSKKKTEIFGKLKGTLHIKGNIVKPIEEDWDACL